MKYLNPYYLATQGLTIYLGFVSVLFHSFNTSSISNSRDTSLDTLSSTDLDLHQLYVNSSRQVKHFMSADHITDYIVVDIDDFKRIGRRIMNFAELGQWAQVKSFMEHFKKYHFSSMYYAISVSVMYEAVKQGSLIGIEVAVDSGIDINIKVSDGKTILWFFVDNACDLRVAQWLVDKGADINTKNNKGETILMYAIDKNNVATVRWSVNNKVDVNAHDNIMGRTALMHAVSQNNLNVVKYLVKCKANIDAKDHAGWTVLMHTNNLEMFEWLVKYGGANVNARNVVGGTPMMHVVMSKGLEGNITKAVQYLIDEDADVDVQDYSGKDVLWYAEEYLAGSEKEEVMKLLTDKKSVSTQQVELTNVNVTCYTNHNGVDVCV